MDIDDLIAAGFYKICDETNEKENDLRNLPIPVICADCYSEEFSVKHNLKSEKSEIICRSCGSYHSYEISEWF